MSHECELCGQECYCDMDDCGGFEQPSDCRCLLKHWAGNIITDADAAYEEDEA